MEEGCSINVVHMFVVNKKYLLCQFKLLRFSTKTDDDLTDPYMNIYVHGTMMTHILIKYNINYDAETNDLASPVPSWPRPP